MNNFEIFFWSFQKSYALMYLNFKSQIKYTPYLKWIS
jgi:hypothetical protein